MKGLLKEIAYDMKSNWIFSGKTRAMTAEEKMMLIMIFSSFIAGGVFAHTAF